MDYEIDTVLDQRYRILERIGEGGMGTVYRARDIELQREVALKILRVEQLDDDAIQRFQREARIASRVEHPNIVQFFSFGLMDGSPFIAMELLDGSSLRKVLDQQEAPLSADRALQIAVQVCMAMELAHKAGVVHRDLKPTNIMLLQSPAPDFVKVVDFGLARLGTDISQRLTQTGTILGTAQYMSPEQCKGQQADARSDVYSLGCIIYEMVCGKPAFDADTPVALIHKHVCEMPAPLLVARPGATFPAGLQSVLTKSMEKDPQKRYATMAAMESDLRLVMSGKAPGGIDGKAHGDLGKRTRHMLISMCCVSLIVAVAFLSLNQHHARSGFTLDKGDGVSSAKPLRMQKRSCLLLLSAAERAWRNGAVPNEGEEFYKAALVAAEDPKVPPQLKLRVYWLYAALLRSEGRTDDSIAFMEQALRFLEHSDVAPTVAFQVYNHAGLCHSGRLQDHDKAVQFEDKAQQVVESMPGNQSSFSAEILENRARIAFTAGQFKKAYELAKEATRISTRSQDLNSRKILQCRYAVTAGAPDLESHLQEVLAQPIENSTGIHYYNLARALQDSGRGAQSKLVAEKALKVFNHYDARWPDAHVRTLRLMAEIAKKDGNEAAAANFLKDADRLIAQYHLRPESIENATHIAN